MVDPVALSIDHDLERLDAFIDALLVDAARGRSGARHLP
jgi:hypothetical protein